MSPYTVTASYNVPGSWDEPPYTEILVVSEASDPRSAYEEYVLIADAPENEGLDITILDSNEDEMSVQDLLEACLAP